MKKLTKVLGILCVAALGIAALTGIALAQGPQDADGDGVCDLCGGETGGLMHGWRFYTGDSGGAAGRGGSRGQGAGEGASGTPRGQGQMGSGTGACDEFVDEDGDGMCDTHPSAGQGGPMGEGRMGRQFSDGEGDWRGQGPNGNGQGLCDEFVDEDGDGVCDNYPQGGQDGHEPTGGRRGGGRFNRQVP